MKKTNLLWVIAVVMIVSAFSAYASANMQSCPSSQTTTSTLINITVNYPCNNDYNSSSAASLVLNATVGHRADMNITSGTFIFTNGATSLRYQNTTMNGSNTDAAHGDFTYTIAASTLSEATYSVVFEAKNTTDVAGASVGLNSSAITFTIDRSPPSVVLNEPYSGSTIVPNNNFVTFKYTPSGSNVANCTVMLNNQVAARSTTSSTIANFSSGVQQIYTYSFTHDNNSIRYIVECNDLAGNVGDSQNITFNVLLGAIAPAIRQMQIAEASSQAPSLQSSSGNANNLQGGLAVVSGTSGQGFDIQTYLQDWGWAYIAGIILIAGFYAFRKKLF